eukprot:CAMPEP_0119132200 /NCGR_PEP_ID=MMETSP1310-20130426/11709_1 /TAXON_ID=464262 /ORGANISM="Genus nov. species nov., Strain RCC2339" /LENGTH=1401 /DNA_ID=CAMNT_0007122819 /DNA_START=214 /DNA_END=4419 /DNA_ORIENTATION=-
MGKSKTLVALRVYSDYMASGYVYSKNDLLWVRVGDFPPDSVETSFFFHVKYQHKKKRHLVAFRNSASHKFLSCPHFGDQVVESRKMFEMELVDTSESVFRFVGLKPRTRMALTIGDDDALEVAENENEGILHFQMLTTEQLGLDESQLNSRGSGLSIRGRDADTETSGDDPGSRTPPPRSGDGWRDTSKKHRQRVESSFSIGGSRVSLGMGHGSMSEPQNPTFSSLESSDPESRSIVDSGGHKITRRSSIGVDSTSDSSGTPKTKKKNRKMPRGPLKKDSSVIVFSGLQQLNSSTGEVEKGNKEPSAVPRFQSFDRAGRTKMAPEKKLDISGGTLSYLGLGVIDKKNAEKDEEEEKPAPLKRVESGMLSLHELMGEADLMESEIFLAIDLSGRYKKRLLSITENYIIQLKMTDGTLLLMIDARAADVKLAEKLWVDDVKKHLYHFTVKNSSCTFKFASYARDLAHTFVESLNAVKGKLRRTPPEFVSSFIPVKEGRGSLWRDLEVSLDGAVICLKKRKKKRMSVSTKKKNLDFALMKSFLKADFLNLFVVTNVTVPKDASDKKYQLQLTGKQGMYRFAFSTSDQMNEWKGAIRNAQNYAEDYRGKSGSLTASRMLKTSSSNLLLDAEKQKEQQKTSEEMDDNKSPEDMLMDRCKLEEKRWGKHYDINHHLLLCCVYGEMEVINYLIQEKQADPDYVLPHLPEGNSFFDIGDTAIKVAYRFDQMEVVQYLQEYEDKKLEEENEKQESVGTPTSVKLKKRPFRSPAVEADFTLGKANSRGSIISPLVDSPSVRRNRSSTVTTAAPTRIREARADYSHIQLTSKQTSTGFFEDRVRKDVPMPEWVNLIPEVLFGSNDLPNLELLRNHLYKEGRLSLSCVMKIIKMGKAMLKRERNVLRLQAPVNVFGDLHGQFYDLLTQLDSLGCPGGGDQWGQLLFLGDYVDRGMFSMEIIIYLLALKLHFPDRIHLLRGNHETRNLTEYFNFRIECLRKYNRKVYAMIMDLFDYLPLAATVTNSQGRFLCMHGGLSPSLQYIEEIDRIHRIDEPPETGPMCDILWCDPYRAEAFNSNDGGGGEEDDDFGYEDGQNWDSDDSDSDGSSSMRRSEPKIQAPSDTGEDILFIHNHLRGSGYIFGGSATEPFLRDNNLLMIVRAHEVMDEGFLEYDFGWEDRPFPQVVTIFSAPNYCDMYGNDAAVMRIKENEYTYMITKATDHPFYLPDLTNAIHYTFPFIMENLSELAYNVLLQLMVPDGEDDAEDTSSKDNRKSKLLMQNRLESITHMRRESMQIRMANEGQVEEAKTIEKLQHVESGTKRFRSAQTLDHQNEANPLFSPHNKSGKRSSGTLPKMTLKMAKAMEVLNKVDEEQSKSRNELQALVKSPSLASTQVAKALNQSGSRNRSSTIAQY